MVTVASPSVVSRALGLATGAVGYVVPLDDKRASAPFQNFQDFQSSKL
jgi:hypothetical protein